MMKRSFEAEKIKFEREQLRKELNLAIDELKLDEVKVILEKLSLEPTELREVQAKTSQLPNLYKNDPTEFKKAKDLASYVSDLVAHSKHDLTDKQNEFLTSKLVK